MAALTTEELSQNLMVANITSTMEERLDAFSGSHDGAKLATSYERKSGNWSEDDESESSSEEEEDASDDDNDDKVRPRGRSSKPVAKAAGRNGSGSGTRSGVVNLQYEYTRPRRECI